MAATFDVVRLTSRYSTTSYEGVQSTSSTSRLRHDRWVVQHKGDTADAPVKEVINHLGNDLALKNADVMELLGVHIRRELGGVSRRARPTAGRRVSPRRPVGYTRCSKPGAVVVKQYL